MTLVEREVAQHFVDTGKRGLSAGDRNVARSQILNDAGKVVRLRHYVDTAKHIAASS